MRQAEAKHPLEQLEPQAPEHAFAETSLVDVEIEFQPVRNDDQKQEGKTQKKKIWNLIEIDAKDRPRKIVSLDGIIDNQFWQFEKDIDHRVCEYGDHENEDLLSGAVFPNKTEKALFHKLIQTDKDQICASRSYLVY